MFGLHNRRSSVDVCFVLLFVMKCYVTFIINFCYLSDLQVFFIQDILNYPSFCKNRRLQITLLLPWYFPLYSEWLVQFRRDDYFFFILSAVPFLNRFLCMLLKIAIISAKKANAIINGDRIL